MKKYFAYDPNDGFETFDTIEARDKWAEAAVEAYLDGDGWSEEVEFVCVGEVTGRAVQCNVQPKPKREDFASEEEYDDALSDWGGDPSFDSICNYEIRPVAATETFSSTKSQSGGGDSPVVGEKSGSLRSDHRGITQAGSTPSTHSDSKFEMAAEPGAAQQADGNAERTHDSADRRSPDGQYRGPPSPDESNRQVWTRRSHSDPYCVNCGKTWDMHICDGLSSCPSPNRGGVP